MKIRDILRAAQSSIAGRYIPDARFEAELLLMHSLGINRVELYTDLERPLSGPERSAYWHLVERRLCHEPAAYITGEVQFYGIDLRVDRRVLIPRPETEMLVEMALGFLSHRTPGKALVADVGTGSGAMAVALARLCPDAFVYGIDISPMALEVARLNVARYGLQDRVMLVQGDLLGPLPQAVDLVVANLPYVKQDELSGLMPEVRVFEPEMALNGGVDGLALIGRLISQVGKHLLLGGMLLLEIGHEHGEAVVGLVRNRLSDWNVKVVRDMAGINRMVVIQTVPVAAGSKVGTAGMNRPLE